ncbi:prolyl 3-hydroxylase OGFOD1-like isoform X2 [Dendronephthya gigantea]|nr:prolyl 3-hydroxylase OGFOD1-like isoform X2 [Dendronephthya gigantea]
MKIITNIPLDKNAIDMSCAKYSNTDVLLCHDDELEGRRIAYIFYLVPPWTKNDGGSLDLYTTDELGQPDKIVKSLIPEWNSLVFFEVTPVSFHQVSEVISDKTRLSISGWFHGPPIDRPSPNKELPQTKQRPIPLRDEILISWVNPMYLQPDIVDDIRESFEENSEIELKDFLLEEKYDALLEELKHENTKWTRIGPDNKRKYEKADESSLTSHVRECLELFKSEPMFKLLTTFTGLKLSDVDINSSENSEKNENEGKPNDSITTTETLAEDKDKLINEKSYRCHGKVCRWSHGCYTLIHDNDPEASEMALDCLFFVGCCDWQGDFGGYTSYLARDEDEELLTINPCSNSMALVYRDPDTLKFVKHINNHCKNSENDAGSSSSSKNISEQFYNIMCTYFE